MCIRDEERFLAANLAYHNALGVSKAYLYLDRCTDASPEIAQSFPWVEAHVCDRDLADPYLSVHQVHCMQEGLTRARADGLDWLMHVDADEFACGDARPEALRFVEHLVPRRSLQARVAAGHLPSMLSKVPQEVAQVVLRPKDVMPMRRLEGAPFWALSYFQRAGEIERPLLDPNTGEVHLLNKRLGNYYGKSIVRVEAAVQPANAHRWRAARPSPGAPALRAKETDLLTLERGHLYHFTVVSGEHWWTKHRKFAEYPDHWERGTPVRFPKQAWKEASVRMTCAEAQAYFADWIAMKRRDLMGPILRGHVVWDPFVRNVLEELPEDPSGCVASQASQGSGTGQKGSVQQ